MVGAQAPIRSPIRMEVSRPFSVFINKSSSILTLPFSNSKTTDDPPNLKYPFSAPFSHLSPIGLNNTSNHRGTNFCHDHIAKFQGRNGYIFPFIFTKDFNNLFDGNWVDGIIISVNSSPV